MSSRERSLSTGSPMERISRTLTVLRGKKVVATLTDLKKRMMAKADAEEAAIREESQDLRDHVILCGCGRVGRPVSLVLEAANAPYIAVESDLIRFRRAKKSGHKVVFGDAGRKRVLEAAGVARAGIVVVTFDRRHAVERILHYAREHNPTVSSIVSAADDQELLPLTRAGASRNIPTASLASVSLVA